MMKTIFLHVPTHAGREQTQGGLFERVRQAPNVWYTELDRGKHNGSESK